MIDNVRPLACIRDAQVPPAEAQGFRSAGSRTRIATCRSSGRCWYIVIWANPGQRDALVVRGHSMGQKELFK
jgi:hypothetical protein